MTPHNTQSNGWDESRFWIFLRSALRRTWNRYPIKYEVLNEARRSLPKEEVGGKKRGRQKWEFQCRHCLNWFSSGKVSVDHIVSCGTLRSFEDLPVFCKRLFCHKSGLQVLCDKCHNLKTYIESHPGIEISEAKKRIRTIEFLKLPISQQKNILLNSGYVSDRVSNRVRRQQSFREIIDKEIII